jgi:signal transduction histidine kinase
MPFRHLSDDVLELLTLLGDVGARFLAADAATAVAGEVFAALSTKLDLEVYLNYLVSDDGAALRLSSYAGITPAVADSLETLQFGDAICGAVAVQRQRIIAEDVQRAANPMFELVRTLGISAYACHPLMAGERLIGTLSFGTRSRERFTPLELELMQAVASFAALAIDRATVVARQRRAQALLSRAQEDERRRISRELHDEMAQLLAGLRMELESLDGMIQLVPQASAKVQRLQRLVSDIGRDVHRIALQLRPAALDDLGLQLALTNYVEQWSQRYHVAIDLHTSGLDPGTPDSVQTTIYRIVQEALTNIIQHARATRVSVIVQALAHHVQAVIEDNGVGFSVEERHHPDGKVHLGLAGMEERASLMGGTLTIESTPGQGTSVYVRIPIPPAPPAVSSSHGQ